MRFTFVFICCWLLPAVAFCQETENDTLVSPERADTLNTQQLPDTSQSEIFFTNPNVASDEVIVSEEKDTEQKEHSPGKAALFSAVLPGLGQAYNKKYWKVPIVYAGLGVSIYFLQDNIKQIKYFKQSYRNATDDDPNTINDSGYNTSSLEEVVSQHKRWRDFSYVGLVAVYLLNIIDANVDAHLFYFDVSRDLSMTVSPSMQFTAQPSPGLTLCLKL